MGLGADAELLFDVRRHLPLRVDADAERGRLIVEYAAARFIDRAMLLLIWNRLMGMARRFTNIATRVRTGTLVVPVRQASAPVEDALVLQAPLLTQTPVPL